MAERISQTQLQQLARVGARARLAELRAEMVELLRVFPELRLEAAGGPGRRAPQKAATAGSAPRGKPTRRRMSAAARRAVSQRMKKYWAERKAKAAKPARGK